MIPPFKQNFLRLNVISESRCSQKTAMLSRKLTKPNSVSIFILQMGIRRNERYDGENEDLFEFSFLRYKDIVMVSYALVCRDLII